MGSDSGCGQIRKQGRYLKSYSWYLEKTIAAFVYRWYLFFLFLRHAVVTRINVTLFSNIIASHRFIQLTVERVRKHSMLVCLYKSSFVLYVWHTWEGKMWIHMISIVIIIFNILWWLNENPKFIHTLRLNNKGCLRVGLWRILCKLYFKFNPILM